MPAKLLMKMQNWLLFQLLNLCECLFLPQFLSHRRKQLRTQFKLFYLLNRLLQQLLRQKWFEMFFIGEAFPKLVLPVGKCVIFYLTLGALIPKKLKNQIWENKYVDLWYIYRVIAVGENKQDISLNISKQGTSTVVSLQQNDQQKATLSISHWLTAFILSWMFT